MSSQLAAQIPNREKVLVIGAGPAGLAAAAALDHQGQPYDIIDSRLEVGGIWADRERTPVWRGLTPVTSKDTTELPELLMPASFPSFPSPDQLAEYLKAYTACFEIPPHLQLGVSVTSLRPYDQEGVWQVGLSGGQVTVYRGIIAAVGTSTIPHLPDWARGASPALPVRVLHSKDWDGASGLEGRSVLVVGSGQSAADIAVDASTTAREVRWSQRTGHWIVPRTIGGVPGDVAALREPAILGSLNERIAETVIRRTMGEPRSFGLLEPERPLLEDRVIVSDDILPRIREGRVTPMRDVRGLGADGEVSFVDGTAWTPDVIVLATGYETGADFLPEGLVPRTPTGALDLFLGAFPRTRDNLAILGQMEVTGGIWPLLSQQAAIAARLMSHPGDPAFEAFRRARLGSDDAIPATAPEQPHKPTEGARGRLASLVDRVQDSVRRTPSRTRPSQGRAVPFMDRSDLQGRLRTALLMLGER